jgi:hypothetical protein
MSNPNGVSQLLELVCYLPRYSRRPSPVVAKKCRALLLALVVHCEALPLHLCKPVVVRRNRYPRGGFHASCSLVGANYCCYATPLATCLPIAYAHACSCGARRWVKSDLVLKMLLSSGAHPPFPPL